MELIDTIFIRFLKRSGKKPLGGSGWIKYQLLIEAYLDTTTTPTDKEINNFITYLLQIKSKWDYVR